MDVKRGLRLVVFSAVIFVLYCGIFLICYRFDNKYTVKNPQPVNGVLKLEESDLERFPVIYPILDWELYRSKLFTPDDFKKKTVLVDELVFIGQYSGFEGRRIDNKVLISPHGDATYRLTLFLPDDLKDYSLELPEIYSAYKLYVNGRLIKEMGEIARLNYQPKTGITSITLPLSGKTEIIIAVSDYTNIYSGIVYPPAFGKAQNVSDYMNFRLVLRTSVFITSMGLAFLYLIIGFFGKQKRDLLPFLYALLCLSFAIFISYPITKTMLSVGVGFYSLERLSYCVLLVLIILIQDKLSGAISLFAKSHITKIMLGLGTFVSFWSILVPVFLNDSYVLMTTYSMIVDVFTLISAVYLSVRSFYDAYKGITYSRWILYGILAFDSALVMDRVFPMFEPIRFGWFTEISGVVLVLAIGVALSLSIARELRVKQAISAQLESVTKMLEVQKSYHPVLLKKEQETQAARHDLRHHFSVIKVLLSDGDLAKVNDYINEYTDKKAPPLMVSFCKHYMTDMLLRLYGGLAENQNTSFSVQANVPEDLHISDSDLCVIISNMLENALEATQKIPADKRLINVNIGIKNQYLGIVVRNSYENINKSDSGKILSSKRKNSEGIGLLSIKNTSAIYGGTANCFAESGMFINEVYIPIK